MVLNYILFKVFGFLINTWFIIRKLIDDCKPLKKNKFTINKVFLVKNNMARKEIKNFNRYNPWQSVLKQEKYFEDDDLLEIDYDISIDNKLEKYMVCYDYPSEILFPPYTINEIKNRKINKKILFAESNDEDCTEITKRYAGPFQDFYKNKPGIIIMKKLFVNEALIITDENLEEKEFMDSVTFNN